MTKPPTDRDQRLAAALRDNLRRRKAQARDQQQSNNELKTDPAD